MAAMWTTGPAIPPAVRSSSRPNFEDWRERARSFAAMAAYTPFDARLTGRGDPRQGPRSRLVEDGYVRGEAIEGPL